MYLVPTLRLDTVEAKGSKILRGEKLKALAIAAWAEAFGIQVDRSQLEKQKADQLADATKQRDKLVAKIREEGSKAWNDIGYR